MAWKPGGILVLSKTHRAPNPVVRITFTELDSVVQPAVTADGEKALALKFGQPRVMALLLALTLFQHLIDGFHNRDLRGLVADLLGVTITDYTGAQTYDLRRLRLKGLIFRPSKTHRYFVTPCGWKVARLFSRLGGEGFPTRRGDVHRTTPSCRSRSAPCWIVWIRNSMN